MKSWLNKVKRLPADKIDRSKYLRLDKNERVIKFEKKFLNYIKKNVNTFNLSSYPNINNVKNKIAKKIGVKKEMIFISAGSDLSLKTCFELFTKPKDRAIILEPTFGMVDVYCGIYNIKPIKVGYDKNLKLNYSKLYKNISKKISLIILANPNSPTGTIIKESEMLQILNKTKKLKIPIVIDEAYEGFYKKSYINFIKKYQNLIVTRTFSKSFGLAGLRAGYAVANKKTINLMSKYRPMYEINSISCSGIEFLLKNYNIVQKHVKEVLIAKNYLKRELDKHAIKYIDTYANFFHIEMGKNIKSLEKKFKRKKILFRKGPGVKGFETYARFSLGSKSQMKKVLNMVKNVYARN